MEWQEIKGVIVSTITAFNAEGEVDEKALRENYAYYLKRGAHGLGVLGTTSEDHLLSQEERRRIVEIARSEAKGKAFVVAGSGMIGTRETVEMTKIVKDAGADVALILSPFYQMPTEEGIIKHFKTVSDAVDIPIMVYNMPPITSNITPQMLERLSKEARIIKALKDSSRDIHQLSENIRLVGDKMSVCTGEDDLFLPSLLLGAKGGYLAGANIAIDIELGIYNAVKEGKLDEARELHLRLVPLTEAYGGLGFQTNIKEAVRMLGRPAGQGDRSPLLLRASDERRDKLKKALNKAGLM
jgi:4-hydroxy-tetrahydrodipicolinate synthase